MNALFGLKTNLSISERAIVATATATAAYISALPAPMHPRLVMTTSTHSANHHHDQQYLQRYILYFFAYYELKQKNNLFNEL